MRSRIILVGVWGTGMSALARLFLSLGYEQLIGIDQTESELTAQLQKQGMQIIYWHDKLNLQVDDHIIYSAATRNCPEVERARDHQFDNHKKFFPPLLYAQFLGELSKYLQTIAVTGTHGKSTTSAMTASVLAQHDPTLALAIIWAWLPERQGANLWLNRSHTHQLTEIIDHIFWAKGPSVGQQIKQLRFIVEADEFNKHFLYLDPDYSIITNIELDHVDSYADQHTYISTFDQFVNKVRYQAFVLPDALGIDQLTDKPTLTPVTRQQFDFSALIWWHNHDNAALALACSEKLTDLSPQLLQPTLQAFRGLRRRAETIGTNQHDCPIISDYAHHPTEIISTYQAVQESYPDQTITCIFQPHQARRLVEFRDQFIDVLAQIDELLIYDIYTARETMADLQHQLPEDKQLRKVSSFEELWQLLASKVETTYTTQIEQVHQHINQTDKGLILLFTAGNLDWEIRKLMQKNQA